MEEIKMILEFRTDRDRNGNALYLAIDTGAECYAVTPRGWLSKDMPTIKRKDRREIIERLEINGWRRVDYIM
jgi:hypothetical protein